MSNPAMRDSGFRWTEGGQSFLHYLEATLENVRESSPERVYGSVSPDGSTVRRVAIPSTAKDLHATVRFDGSPHSLLEFIRAGRRGATIEYFPSLANPSEVYPCVLMDATDPEPDARLSFTYTSDLVLRRTDGGTWLGVVGGEPLFYWRAGNTLPGLTFTRSGTAGTYVDSSGNIQNEGTADIFRTTWADWDRDGLVDTPLLRLERSGKNYFRPYDDMSAGFWGTSNATATPNDAADPAGGTAATKLDDSGTNTGHRCTHATATITAGQFQPVSGFVKAAEYDRIVVSLGDYDGSDTNFGAVDIDLGAETITDISGGDGASSDRYLVAVPNHPGWYYFAAMLKLDNVSTSNFVYFGLHNGTSSVFTGTGTSGVHLWGLGLDRDGLFYSSVIPTTSAEVTRNAEIFYATFEHRPQVMTGYIEFIERESTPFDNASTLVFIGNAATGAFLNVRRENATDRYLIQHNNGIGSVTTNVDISPVYGDRVRVRWVLNADGSALIGAAKDTGSGYGAETVSTASAALALATAWEDTRLYLMHPNSLSKKEVKEVKILPRIATMAEMAAL